jgi:hypothetical protein
MTKKFREITVDKIKYGWSLKQNEYTTVLNIWKDKKIIHKVPFNSNMKCLSGTLSITPVIVKETILSILKSVEGQSVIAKAPPIERLIETAQEHHVLKQLIKIDKIEREREGYTMSSPRWNAITEIITKDGTRLAAAKIEINGMFKFDLPPNEKYTEERAKNPNHPINIERITFLVNDEEIEFARNRTG